MQNWEGRVTGDEIRFLSVLSELCDSVFLPLSRWMLGVFGTLHRGKDCSGNPVESRMRKR